MSGLFKKLNVLLRAGINEALGGERTAGRPLSPEQLGERFAREIDGLRARIADALRHETALRARLAALQDEIDRLDRQADEALERGRETLARHVVGQLQRAQQRRAMAEADLREHQVITQESIARVNRLEAAAARRGESAEPGAAATEAEAADRLRDVRAPSGRFRVGRPGGHEDDRHAPPPDEQAVEYDLARRRARLSR